ncbi:hypothetical protein [Embleya sp. NBC_00896]|uniref:hypothetical protein n=1 Tax=Embleya sp. NBC_00896 TaxID=2975961 RepID=UPI00386F7AF9|nr:SMI1/KNR4 family protein [Embleya sp. NBC_00896]
MSIDRLIEVVKPPQAIGFVQDWATAESELGTALPQEYMRLVDIFGAGSFNDYLDLLTPPSQYGAGDIISTARELHELASVDWYGNPYDPYSIFPNPGGLLRWAESETEDEFYWLTNDKDPNKWPIVAREQGEEWHKFEVSTTRFILDTLSSTATAPFSRTAQRMGQPFFRPSSRTGDDFDWDGRLP